MMDINTLSQEEFDKVRLPLRVLLGTTRRVPANPHKILCTLILSSQFSAGISFAVARSKPVRYRHDDMHYVLTIFDLLSPSSFA